ncbi:MAG TPA: CoA transferase [Stellaceae bacterium]|jgi:formyl-CoA transferase|nr:CoA transferase [Stellaceae bacterium]
MAEESARGPKGPLSGVTVLDLCSYLAGPYGCTLLADLGADVIKIEAPSGDMLRHFPSTLEGDSRFFVGTNRGKRALALDLKQPEGLAVLHRLVATADVLVENFRPSVPARLGIDYPRLKKINPRLVYCGLTGYGDQGPLSDKGGFDQVLQCLTGMAVFQGAASRGDGPQSPQLVLGSVLDYFTSALLAYGVAAALFHRERSGTGQYLSLSLLRSALTIQAGRFVWAEGEGRDVARDSGAGGLTGIHPTKEGALYISVHSNHFFAALCELVGRPELAKDPRCESMRSRAAHAAEILPELRAALATRTALEWEEIFGERVPCAAVRQIEEMFDHPQVLGNDLVATFDHPVVGRYRGLSKPVHLAETPGPTPTAAPGFGQHSSEILSQYGYSTQDIAVLRERGIVL